MQAPIAPPSRDSCPITDIRFLQRDLCTRILIENKTPGMPILGVRMAPLHQRLGFDAIGYSSALAAAMVSAFFMARLPAELLARSILHLTGVVERVSSGGDYNLGACRIMGIVARRVGNRCHFFGHFRRIVVTN